MLKKVKNELERLIWAHQAWRGAYSLCELGMSLPENETDTNFGIMSGIIVSYARPFTGNNGLGGLSEEFTKFDDDRHDTDHYNLIKLRHKVFGHRDEIWTKEKIGANRRTQITISEEGILSSRGFGISADPCQEILELLEIQIERCSAKILRILGEELAKGGAFDLGTYILIDEPPYIKLKL